MATTSGNYTNDVPKEEKRKRGRVGATESCKRSDKGGRKDDEDDKDVQHVSKKVRIVGFMKDISRNK